jgi:hypothetical protein
MYWYWPVAILVGILSTKEYGGNSLRFGGKPFFPQNGGWAPQKGGRDPPFEEKMGSRQKNNTEKCTNRLCAKSHNCGIFIFIPNFTTVGGFSDRYLLYFVFVSCIDVNTLL